MSGFINYEKLNYRDNSDIAITFYAISSYLGNSDARRNLENIALQNNNLAQYYIGNMYLKGLSEKQDYDKAIYWYSKAAEQDEFWSYFACYNLGKIYEQGLGVKQDINKALEYYKRSAEQGNKEAIQALERLEIKE